MDHHPPPSSANPRPHSDPSGPTAAVWAEEKRKKEERKWAMFCHLAALAGFVVTVPFAGVIGPLLIWLIKRGEFPMVEDQGKESVNFQISMVVYYLISGLLVFVVIGIPMLIALFVFNLICVIIAAVKANDGIYYRYPMSIRFLR